MHHQKVENICINDPIVAIVSEGTDFEPLVGLVDPDAQRHFLVLKEARDVVDDGEEGNVDNLLLGGVRAAEGGRPEGLTHGYVAIERDEHGQHDGAGIGDQVERPQVGQDAHVKDVVVLEVACIREDGRQAVEWDGGQEDQGVGHGHGAQQQGRGRLVGVVEEDGEGDYVAGQPEQDERAHHHRVDGEVEQGTARRHVEPVRLVLVALVHTFQHLGGDGPGGGARGGG